MDKRIKIVWRVEDGYAGGDAPHYTVMRASDFDPDDTDDEIGEQIVEAVKEDFEASVSIDLRTTDVEAAIKEIRAQLATTERP